MSRRDDLFEVGDLVAPEPTPALADLFCVLLRLRRHPIAVELGFGKDRQIWELHRVLYNVPDVIVELLTEWCMEEHHIPLPCEIRPFVRTCWRTWSEMAVLGFAVDTEEEPNLPAPPPRRWRVLRRNVMPPARLWPTNDDD